MITGQGPGAAVKCSGPAACEWRFTGTATGTPFDKTVSVVVEIETTGTWDASGCQQIASGTVSFARREGQKNIGWRVVLSGLYCTGTTGGHFSNGTFITEASRGRYSAAVGQAHSLSSMATSRAPRGHGQ